MNKQRYKILINGSWTDWIYDPVEFKNLTFDAFIIEETMTKKEAEELLNVMNEND